MVDVVVCGHLTLDQPPGGVRPGGAAYYATITAQRQGLRVGLLTSFGPDFPREAIPADVELAVVPSERTTTFRIGAGRLVEGRRVRELAVLDRATDLEASALPPAWLEAGLGVLGPVTGEVDPALAAEFPDSSLVALPPGWMRQGGARGGVDATAWCARGAVAAAVGGRGPGAAASAGGGGEPGGHRALPEGGAGVVPACAARRGHPGARGSHPFRERGALRRRPRRGGGAGRHPSRRRLRHHPSHRLPPGGQRLGGGRRRGLLRGGLGGGRRGRRHPGRPGA